LYNDATGVDGQLVIYHTTVGLTSSCPSTVISPVLQVEDNYFCNLSAFVMTVLCLMVLFLHSSVLCFVYFGHSFTKIIVKSDYLLTAALLLVLLVVVIFSSLLLLSS